MWMITIDTIEIDQIVTVINSIFGATHTAVAFKAVIATTKVVSVSSIFIICNIVRFGI